MKHIFIYTDASINFKKYPSYKISGQKLLVYS